MSCTGRRWVETYSPVQVVKVEVMRAGTSRGTLYRRRQGRSSEAEDLSKSRPVLSYAGSQWQEPRGFCSCGINWFLAKNSPAAVQGEACEEQHAPSSFVEHIVKATFKRSEASVP